MTIYFLHRLIKWNIFSILITSKKIKKSMIISIIFIYIYLMYSIKYLIEKFYTSFD